MPEKEPKPAQLPTETAPAPRNGGRSILVTDSSADSSADSSSQVAANSEPSTDDAPPIISRTAKTISPPHQASDTSEPVKEGLTPDSTDEVSDGTVKLSPEKATAKTDDEAIETESAKPDEIKQVDLPEDEAAERAEADKKAAASEARREELEELIDSGKYVVPINAVRRKRSHMLVVYAVVFLLVLIAAIDLLADASVLKTPAKVPHTHFISR